MDRHSFLSALPFLVPLRISNSNRDDDPFLVEPRHILLRDHELSVEVEGSGVACFDASGVSFNNDPGISSCQVYINEAKVCIKFAAGRVYFVDWSQILTVLVGGKDNDHNLPQSILLRFACCNFRLFCMKDDVQDLKDKYSAFQLQLENLIASATIRPSMPNISDGSATMFHDSSSATRSRDSFVSPTKNSSSDGSHSPSFCRRRQHFMRSAHEGVQSLIAVLELPSSDPSSAQGRDVFNLLNNIADDMQSSYSNGLVEDDTRHADRNTSCPKRSLPDHVELLDYFPAPRTKITKSSCLMMCKERTMQATQEWMDLQKRATKERHEALLLPNR
ncbi:hypothetical protein MPSEU_000426600 [Mayamaea pseudoterrestris]|nr:hypothetical protein MPSEU_000426600 [Mayamaea pseudoterrestris]